MSKPLDAGVQVVFLELACGLPDDHAECSHGPVPRSKSLKLAKCNKRCPDNSMTGTTGTVSQPQKASWFVEWPQVSQGLVVGHQLELLRGAAQRPGKDLYCNILLIPKLKPAFVSFVSIPLVGWFPF